MKILILNIFLAIFIASFETKRLKFPIDDQTMKQIKRHFKNKKYRKQITLKQLKNMKNEILELKDMITNYKKENKNTNKAQQQTQQAKKEVKNRQNSKKIKRRKKVHRKRHHKKHKKIQRKNVQLSEQDFEDKFQKVISKSLELPGQQRALFQQIYDEMGEQKIKDIYRQIYMMQPQNRRANLADIPMNTIYMGIKLLQPLTFLYFKIKGERNQMSNFLAYELSSLNSVMTMKQSMRQELTDSSVKLRAMVKILGTLAYTQSEQIKVYKDSMSL